MSTAKELNSVFNQAEELVGTSPEGADLRNAIHAVITKSMDLNTATARKQLAKGVLVKNVEYLARSYEAVRTTKQFLGGIDA